MVQLAPYLFLAFIRPYSPSKPRHFIPGKSARLLFVPQFYGELRCYYRGQGITNEFSQFNNKAIKPRKAAENTN